MNAVNSQDLIQFDQQHLWHPYASMTHAFPSLLVDHAQGATLTLADGRELVDGMSSWWSAIHGYNHPVLNQAIEQQTKKMAHIMFGGLTHEPAIQLGKLLLNITPQHLQHIFYTDSGSIAVEVAIKMVLQYAQAKGMPKRQRLMTIRNGYHGDTFATMSVCDPVNGMHHLFSHMLPQQIFAPAPPNTSDNISPQSAIDEFAQLIGQHHTEVAGVILEPIVQNTGGMRVYSPEYLKAIRELTQQHQIPLILDEIATGFGRTGRLFACEHAAVEPDILCIGKALTGGYMTLGATLCTSDIAQTISDADPGRLMHGPTFMANPLACAVAHASTELLLNSNWQDHVLRIEAQLKTELMRCKALAMVADVRVMGTIGVIELMQPVELVSLQNQFVEAGVWIRPFGKLVYIMPSYIISSEQLSTLTQAMFDVVQQLDAS